MGGGMRDGGTLLLQHGHRWASVHHIRDPRPPPPPPSPLQRRRRHGMAALLTFAAMRFIPLAIAVPTAHLPSGMTVCRAGGPAAAGWTPYTLPV